MGDPRSPAAPDPGTLMGQFAATRAMTMEMVDGLEGDDFVVQTAPYTSPPKWHVGHVSWIYEVVMGRIDPGYRSQREDLSGYLNSYYQRFGEPGEKGRRGTFSRPTTDEVLSYFRATSGRVAEFVASRSLDEAQARLLEIGIHHECQHQELLAYDLQHMLGGRYEPAGGKAAPPPPADPGAAGEARVGGGLYRLGHPGGGFAYDIEMPEHAVYTEDYAIDRLPVTNGQYARFVEDGGYSDYRHWLADGWESVKENGWDAPMYWERDGEGWQVDDFAGKHAVDPSEPVRHVSFYEADAYCRWAGKRLPTEAEWEKAALWDEGNGRKRRFPWGDGGPTPERANLLESRLWGCAPAGSYPAGASPSGCLQMIGDVWEWTSSEFAGYPGFRTGFEEYNDKWFTGQKVLRGGSFGTPSASIRGTCRNFFRLGERWMFCGFRCARDA